jgi:signal transduction histidine kinase
MATRVTAYRVVKEALTNAWKHAGAQLVVVTLAAEEGGLRVRVTDDGRGATEDLMVTRPGHLGVTGMRDRVTVAGGELAIESRPGEGTTVSLWLPFGPAEDGDRQEAS